jgi:hypothetical protein
MTRGKAIYQLSSPPAGPADWGKITNGKREKVREAKERFASVQFSRWTECRRQSDYDSHVGTQYKRDEAG